MIAIRLKRGNGDKPMQDIRDSLINTESMAVMRAEAELDKVWYLKRTYTLDVPYNADLGIHDFVRIIDSKSKLNLTARVESISVTNSIDSGLKMKINAVNYSEFL